VSVDGCVGRSALDMPLCRFGGTVEMIQGLSAFGAFLADHVKIFAFGAFYGAVFDDVERGPCDGDHQQGQEPCEQGYAEYCQPYESINEKAGGALRDRFTDITAIGANFLFHS